MLLVGFALAASSSSQWEQSRRSGDIAREQGKYSDARKWFETALSQGGFKADDLRRADLDDELAGMCQVLGDQPAAERLYADALTVLDKHPNDGDDVRAVVLGGLGLFRAREGRLADADGALEKAAASARLAFRESDPRLASVESSFGQIKLLEGKFADAEALLRKAVAIQKTAAGVPVVDRIISETSLGSIYTSEGRYSEAESALNEADEEASRLGKSYPVYAGTMIALADLYRLEGRRSRGEPLLRKAQAIYEAAFGPDSARVGEVLLDRSLDALAEKKAALAEDEVGQALKILRKADGPEHPLVSVGELRLAQAYSQHGKYVEAEGLLRHALPIQEKTWPGGHFVIADCLLQLAEVEKQQQHYPDAELNYRNAIAAYEKAGTPGAAGLAAALRQYARLLRTNRSDEAKILERRAEGLQRGVQAFK